MENKEKGTRKVKSISTAIAVVNLLIISALAFTPTANADGGMLNVPVSTVNLFDED